MKKLKIGKLALGLIVLFSLNNCDKQEVDSIKPLQAEHINPSNSSPQVVANIQASANGESINLNYSNFGDDFFSGNLYGNQLSKITFAQDYFDEVYSLTKTSDYSYSNSTNSTIKNVVFENFNEINSQEFEFDISINQSPSVSIKIQNNGFNLVQFKNVANDLNPNPPGPPGIAPYIAYLIVAGVISVVAWMADAALEYCQTVIKAISSNCEANLKCVHVDLCDAYCYDC